jgi:GNAT superfamily N-acetyltransferase
MSKNGGMEQNLQRHVAGLEIRAVDISDVPTMAGIQLASALSGFAHIFPAELPKPTQAGLEDEWRAIVTDTAQVALIGDVSGEPAGVVAFGGGGFSPCALRKLYVTPGFQGKGVGSALHDRAIVGLRSLGCATAHLWVLERNITARRMYERKGWELRHWTRSDWPGSGILELCYTLELATRL